MYNELKKEPIYVYILSTLYWNLFNEPSVKVLTHKHENCILCWTKTIFSCILC